MNTLEQQLLNNYQRDFSLKSTPFSEIAQKTNTDTKTVLATINKLMKEGSVTRVGPVFRPNTIGASTLAAMKIPSDKLEIVADLVNSYVEVNHNYERQHEFNLWFVATAPNAQHLESVILEIENLSGFSVMRLPMVKEYHIDLGFKMPLAKKHSSFVPAKHQSTQAVIKHSTLPKDETQTRLIAEIQSGLPIVEEPYKEIADKLSISEEDVIRRIKIMLTTGTIKRMGVIVRHHELGYRANAMLVWDIADEQVNKFGTLLSQENCVTLCYQRPRHLPHWPYNLFTMIHGKDTSSVKQCINDIVEKHSLQNMPKATLFSTRRFKQRGACYSHANMLKSSESQTKVANHG